MKAMHLVPLAICTLGAMASAQTPTYIWSPPNAQTLRGGRSNTYPFLTASSTFQQVHDPENMGQLMTMKGLAFRNYLATTIKGRSWDLRLTLSHTSVTAQTVTTNFANNLGTTNTTIVFGSATTWPTFSFKDFTSTGTFNPPSFTIPFSSPYVYIPQLGSLCWEWRHKNATSTTAQMFMDGTTGLEQKGTIGASIGTGCIATGNTTPATATVTTPVTGSIYQYQLDLANATSSAITALAIGLTKNSQNIGWCSNLELNPLLNETASR